MKSEIYLCITIDCECDKGAHWRTKKPLRFHGIQDGIGQRLQPMFRQFRAKATYLLSPEVMRDEASVATLASLEGDHELGSHLHGEFAEPNAFVPDVTNAFQRDYPKAIEDEKLTYLTDTFASAFGRRPTSFRAGRFGIGPNTLPILERLGYQVESSVTPGMDWSEKGTPGLSFVGSPTQPYHPNPIRPEESGNSPIWEVPVTIRPRALQSLPFVGKHVEPRWLRPTHGTGEALCAVARDEIQASRGRGPVVLTCMFHNVEIIPDASPYARNEREANGIMDRLRALLRFAEKEGIRCVGLSDIPQVFDDRN